MGKLQAAFFFGAGISRPSGAPLVNDITSSALNGKWYFTTEGFFLPGENPNPAIVDYVTPVVQQFLIKVRDCVADYLTELNRSTLSRAPHYEDLFSLAEQAARPELDHVPNLAVVEFLRRLRRETAPLHCGFKGGSSGAAGFTGLAMTACDFLHWVVHHSLHNPSIHRRGLEVLSATANAVQALDIFTLNHDVLVEDQFRADGIVDVEKGFDDRSHGSCSVFRGWPTDTRKRVRLFKLHGSSDWYLYEFPDWARQYAIPDGDFQHCRDQDGRLLTPVEWKAAFLSGTIVKEQRYGLGFWGGIISEFQGHLSRHAHLICCGYSFGDPGINQRISQWMNNLPGNNQLVVLTLDSEEKFFSDKPAWMLQLRDHGRIKLVQKYLEHCTVKDLEPYFDPL